MSNSNIAGRPHFRGIVELEPGVVRIRVECPACHKVQDVDAPAQGVLDWLIGTLIQRALPQLNTTQRELLMTGICQECWDRNFGDAACETDTDN